MPRPSKERSEAPSSIAEDNDSSAETITPPMTMEALKKRCEELEARLQAREVTPSPSTYSERSRSQKIPDPPLFTDGKNPTWENWYGKVQDKLEINADLFPSERAKLGYVHSRLSGDAAETTQSRRERGCSNPYKTADELLEELAQLFDDPDKEANFRRDYYNLVQGQKKFSEFYTQFQRLSFYLGYQEKQLIADLKDKINPRLRSAWVTQLIQPSTLKEIRSYLIRLDNDQRAIREIKDREAMTKARTTKQVTFAEEPAKAIRRTIETKVTDQSKPRGAVLTSAKENDLLTGNCFLCHKPGHTSKECPDRSSRINALDDEFDRSSNFDSESDPKN